MLRKYIDYRRSTILNACTYKRYIQSDIPQSIVRSPIKHINYAAVRGVEYDCFGLPNVLIVSPATSLFIARTSESENKTESFYRPHTALSSCYTQPANNRVSHAINRTRGDASLSLIVLAACRRSVLILYGQLAVWKCERHALIPSGIFLTKKKRKYNFPQYFKNV